jgi:mRNA-degrading endonuclease toxin of MazEF toxin-antitoxin module
VSHTLHPSLEPRSPVSRPLARDGVALNSLRIRAVYNQRVATREQLRSMVEDLPAGLVNTVAEMMISLGNDPADPEAIRTGDIVDDWGNLSALRRASSIGKLGSLSRAEITDIGETLSEEWTRIEREEQEGMGLATMKRAEATMGRGDVWWYERPGLKRRPALILTPQEAIASVSEVYVLLATTAIRGLHAEVELGPRDGLPCACVLNADQIGAADKNFLTSQVTAPGTTLGITLGAEKLSELSRGHTPAPEAL